MTAAAAPHGPVGVKGIASGKSDQRAILQPGIDPPVVHGWLPVARRADFYTPANFSRQGVPTNNAPVPGAGPNTAIGNTRRRQAAFALHRRGVLPRPQRLP